MTRLQSDTHSRPSQASPGLNYAIATRAVPWKVVLAALWHFTISSVGAQTPPPASPPILLTNVGQMVALGTNFPADRYEARLEGVVIYVSPSTRRLYVQSGDQGMQVNLQGSVAAFHVSHRVEVRGAVLGGLPAIRLMNCQADVLGEAPMPVAKPMSAHRLAVGDEPFRYTSVRGMVRDMVSDKDNLVMLMAHEGLLFQAIIPVGNLPLPREWLDAEVELRGHSWPVFNNAGRASGFRFHLPETNYVTILGPGVPSRFDRPLLPCAEAGRLPEQWGPRIRISGTVTVHRPDIGFYVDDGTGVIYVQLLQVLPSPAGSRHLGHEPQTWLQPGERVEVIGVRHNWYSLTPTLLQAEYRRIGPGQPIKPLEVSLSQLLEGRHPGRLVTLEARLLDQRQLRNLRLNYQSLVLRAGDDIFQARWESELPAKWDLKLDRYVKITGVNDAEGSSSRKGSTFQILLRSPADVVPAPEPPFWTRRDLQRIALAVGVVTLLAGAWILMQRWQMRRLERRVGERTAALSGANSQLQAEVVQRRAAEGSLRASEARKAAVLETALDSIITIDQEGRVLDFNPAAEKTFGYTRADALGREMAELIIPPSLRDLHRAGLKRAVDTGVDTMTGRRIEIKAQRRDGGEFPVELALARIRTEAGSIFTAHIQDISERKRAETIQRAIYEISGAVHAAEDLKSFHARIHEVIRSVMPAENFFLLLHDPATDLHEYVYHVDQMDPWPAPRKVTRGLVGHILRTGRSLLVDRESMTNPDNEWHSVSGTPSAIWLGVPLRLRGATIGVMAVQDYHNPDAYSEDEERILAYMADQTALAIERKRTEAALAESERRLRQSLVEAERSLVQEKELSELKSRFVSMVSHEFRTPLGIIMSSAEILDAYLDRLAPEERSENLRDIFQASRHMAAMMEEVLLLGRVEAGKMTCRPVSLDLAVHCARLVDEVTSATGGRCPIELTTSSGLAGAQADEGLLRHILTNLLNNAVKYSPSGAGVEFRVEAKGPDVVFAIRDHGIGIPEADQRQLFQAFHRGRNVGEAPGTGLGMVIVKHCVQLHGGSIDFESREGHGTTFTVALPLLDAVKGKGSPAIQSNRASV